MTQEKKKGGFWASLFGRNKNQEEQTTSPEQDTPAASEHESNAPVAEIINEAAQTETSPEPQPLETSASQIEQQELAELASEIAADKNDKITVAPLETSVEEVIAPENVTAFIPSDEVAVIEPINEESLSPAESDLTPREAVAPAEVIEAANVIDNAPLEAEIPADIVSDVKDELRADIDTKTQEKPSEGGFFSRLVKGLLKTKQNIGAGFRAFFLGKKIDDELFEELEEQLLIADIGVPTTNKIINNLTEHASRKQLQDAELLYQRLKVEMAEILKPVAQPLVIDGSKKPYVILMVGVNGVGKTTTIGKLARKFQNEGKSVMLAAGDTFRAAAVEQLQVWGERNHIPVVAQSTGSDSASVIFDAMQSAAARHVDILIADTAGRLQNKNNLMDELKKIVRVMKKYDESAPHEIMLTLDAGTGQNAISQAKLFDEAVGLTGISLTKLDGTAKGGVIFAIADQFKLPIRYIGVGEKIEDLREFNAEEFIEALFVHEEE